MGIDDFSAPVDLIPDSIANPALGSITGPAPGSVAGSIPDSVIGPALGVVVGCIALVVIDPTKSNYFYGKQVTAEDLTSSKLYMKRTIWIGRILFDETGEV